MATVAPTKQELDQFREIEPTILSLKTQLVSKGMTRELLAQGDHSTLRIHVYASGMGEDHGLHAHVEEEHTFIVLHGEAQFFGINGKLPVLRKNQGLYLPKGCFYEFTNPGTEPLVLLRFGATEHKVLNTSRVTPAGEPILGRQVKHPHLANPTFIENAFFE